MDIALLRRGAPGARIGPLNLVGIGQRNAHGLAVLQVGCPVGNDALACRKAALQSDAIQIDERDLHFPAARMTLFDHKHTGSMPFTFDHGADWYVDFRCFLGSGG